MRILVLSDSHGDTWGVKEILLSEPTAEAVLFCGDGEREMLATVSFFSNKAFFMVSGNCDFGSLLPAERAVSLENAKILLVHGHNYHVKLTDNELISHARGQKADLVVFGHTHTAKAEYDNGLFIVNPGSCKGSYGTYATIDITAAGIVPRIRTRDKIRL